MDQANSRGAGATPPATNTAGAVPSIETPALDSLLATFSICDSDPMAPKAAYENARAALLAHIDAHVARHAQAARDAALEEAAKACRNWASGTNGAYRGACHQCADMVLSLRSNQEKGGAQ